MFILLQSGAMLNLFWLQDCFVGKHDKNIVIFYMINGTKLIEEYSTEVEAQKRVEDVHFAMDEASAGDTKPIIVDELPTENISKRRTYLIRVSDDPEDGYQEWKYIEDPETGEYHWEMLGIQKDYSYSKEDIDIIVSNINNSISNLSNRENLDVSNLYNVINTVNLNVVNLTNRVENLENLMNNTQNNISNLQNLTTNLQNLTNNMQNNITNITNNISNITSNINTMNNTISNIQIEVTNIYNILDWNDYE